MYVARTPGLLPMANLPLHLPPRVLPRRLARPQAQHRQPHACDPQEIAAIELALRCKGNLAVLGSLDQIRLGQGPSVGALWAVFGSRFRVEITGAMQSGRNEFEIDIVNPLAEPADWRCRSTAREMVHHHQS